MSHVDVGLSPEQRARLAHKGRLLYGKFCGTGGRGICAESFALYHIWRGEPEVALDLLLFLEAEIEALKAEDPAGRLAMTEELAGRLRHHLEHEGEEPARPLPMGSHPQGEEAVTVAGGRSPGKPGGRYNRARSTRPRSPTCNSSRC